MNRQEAERRIMEATVDALLGAGFMVTVNDSEEDTLVKSTDRAQILAAMRTSDSDALFVHLPGRRSASWVQLVYGNSGWDTLSDYTTDLEDVLKPVNALSEQLDVRYTNAFDNGRKA